ncbi:MAG: hypothetical protein HQ543_08135 [Bacteroidetes bacterium]|nr:hypothetical protein [Bacteroidota bacterium]
MFINEALLIIKMIGQWRKCKFCRKKFRLKKIKTIVGSKYNFVILDNRYTGEKDYVHKKCYYLFIRTKPKNIVSEFKAGFNIRGPYFEGGFRKE